MRRMKRAFLAASAVLVLIASGCLGGDDGGGSACTVDTDCSSTQTCTDGQCVSKCAGVQCQTGQACNETTGRCEIATACTVDTDCSSTQRCASDFCVEKCAGVQCSGGTTCDAQTGQCDSGGASCTSDLDCLDAQGQDLGRICEGGSCVGGNGASCDTVACGTGYDCVIFQSQSGSSGYCLEPCTGGADCENTSDYCATTGAAAGHCDQNLCSNNAQLGAYGIQVTDWLGPCNVDGTGDGTCLGPIALKSGFELGLCILDGQVAPGGACRVDAGRANRNELCDAGECLAPDNQTSGTCAAWCGLLDGQSCADVNGAPQTCAPFGGLTGMCYPQSASPAAPGASCTTSPDEMVCTEDHVCTALGQSDPTTCMPWCKRLDPSCPTGTTCMAFDSSEQLLGICAN